MSYTTWFWSTNKISELPDSLATRRHTWSPFIGRGALAGTTFFFSPPQYIFLLLLCVGDGQQPLISAELFSRKQQQQQRPLAWAAARPFLLFIRLIRREEEEGKKGFLYIYISISLEIRNPQKGSGNTKIFCSIQQYKRGRTAVSTLGRERGFKVTKLVQQQRGWHFSGYIVKCVWRKNVPYLRYTTVYTTLVEPSLRGKDEMMEE